MKLTMLGTGNAMATECYNTCFVLSDGGQHFLVDGGGGNTLLTQLKKANIDWQDIHDIFITHKHIDHLLGIIWMIRLIGQNMNNGKYDGDVTIYGHDEVISIINEMTRELLQPKVTKFMGNRIKLVVVMDGREKEILGKKVTFFDIQSTKDKQYGFCMEYESGKSLVCCGDEPYNDYEKKYAKGCTWLLHEAFCLFSQADKFHPYEKHHSTVKDACELASQLEVKNLLLYHTEDKNIANRKELYLAEGKPYFDGNLFVPDDLETYEL